MTLQDALKKLGISEYLGRIIQSNSKGELFYLEQYFYLANILDESDKIWFANWFNDIVDWANNTWERPESVYQHIYTILINEIKKHPV